MNGFADHGLDEDAFGEKKSISRGIRSFDAFLRQANTLIFPAKTKPTYTRRTSTGGYTTLLLIIISVLLSFTELRRWYAGLETHLFSVEKGVSHHLQINLDIVVSMRCADLHINVQDASGDRILAGDMLAKDPTTWRHWLDVDQGVHRLESGEMMEEQEKDTHAGHVLGEIRSAKRKFKSTPRLGRRDQASAWDMDIRSLGNILTTVARIIFRNACIQWMIWLMWVAAFNFSHVVNELSFGPLYPSIQNPLDKTYAITENNFFKFQYYCSVVPTVYTRSPNPNPSNSISTSLFTNQYAVTSQSHSVPERSVPGIFFKFDIEPILLTIRDERGGFMALVVRIVNVMSGVLVGGGWCYQLMGWARDLLGGKKREKNQGVLDGNGRFHEEEDE
ncbi:MAG: hypothetical protein Q9163_001422 [Psora crenata]